MPNHVTNNLTFKGDPRELAEMLERIKNAEYGIGTIDFNKIIPMPPSLGIEAGSATDRGLKEYKTFVEAYLLARKGEKTDLLDIPEDEERRYCDSKRLNPSDWELGKKAFINQQKYGAPTWYEWCCEHWNTKWNAYGYEKGEDYAPTETLSFLSAWSAPHPILEKLSELYPDITFTHEWADEDLGQNCGRREYYGGERTEEYTPENCKEAIEFSMRVISMESTDCSEEKYLTPGGQ